MQAWQEFELKSFKMLVQYFGNDFLIIPKGSPSGPMHFSRRTVNTASENKKYDLFPSFFVDFGDVFPEYLWNRPWSITPDFIVINKSKIENIWEFPKSCKKEKKENVCLADVLQVYHNYIEEKLWGKKKESITSWLMTSEKIQEFKESGHREGRFVIFIKNKQQIDAVIDCKRYNHRIPQSQITKLISDSQLCAALNCYLVTNRINNVDSTKGELVCKNEIVINSSVEQLNFIKIDYKAPEILSGDRFYEKYEQQIKEQKKLMVQ